MKVTILYKDSKVVVKAVYIHNVFAYTKTYIIDPEGFVDNYVTVFPDGSYEIGEEEVL